MDDMRLELVKVKGYLQYLVNCKERLIKLSNLVVDQVDIAQGAWNDQVMDGVVKTMNKYLDKVDDMIANIDYMIEKLNFSIKFAEKYNQI